METTTRYCVLPGHYAFGSTLLVKFHADGHYWYWGRKEKSWILGTPLFREHWLDGHLIAVTEEKGKRIIEEEVKNFMERKSGEILLPNGDSI
jgi:hypothetical protein